MSKKKSNLPGRLVASTTGRFKWAALKPGNPPAYPQLVNKLETAMGLNVGVSACYDATGNIFLLKLLHP